MYDRGYILFERSTKAYRKAETTECRIIGLSSPFSRGLDALFQIWLPLLLGIGAAAVMGFYALSSDKSGGNSYMVGIAVVMMAGALVSFVSHLTIRTRVRKELKAYFRQIDDAKSRLSEFLDRRKAQLEDLNPHPSRLLEVARHRSYLWERSSSDKAFLCLRLGLERVQPSGVSFVLPAGVEESLIKDEAAQRALELRDYFQNIYGVPGLLNLPEYGSLGITGDPAQASRLVRAVLAQLVTFQSAEDVRLLAFYPPERAEDWFWLGWLPHTRPLEELPPRPMLAFKPDDVQYLLRWLEETLAKREQMSQSYFTTQEKLPYLVVFIEESQELRLQRSLINLLLDRGKQSNILFIFLAKRHSDLPKGCMVSLNLGTDPRQEVQLIVRDNRGGASDRYLQPDGLDLEASVELARTLCPIRLQDPSSSVNLPSTVHLFDLLGWQQLSPNRLRQHWDSQNQTNLSIILGVGKDGQLVTLNLKEQVHGVHGLLAGRTGSGKGELLANFVANLILNNDPRRLNLVLADFKGGHTFRVFKEAPHCVSFITDIEKGGEHEVGRLLTALTAELERREKLISLAQERYGSWIQRIDQYQQRATDLEPLPYLIVIIDEFARLSDMAQEHLDRIADITMRGRSVGVFLLLSMQYPEGLVRAKVNSNLRYRLCLKVNSADESSAVLQSPEAKDLNVQGRGYFRCDSLLQIFQGARVMGHTLQAVRPATRPIQAVRLLGLDWLPEASGQSQTEQPADQAVTSPSDVEILVETSREAVKAQPLRLHQPCLPPLPTNLPVTGLLGTVFDEKENFTGWPQQPPYGWMTLPFAKMDLYWEQQQPLRIVDFSRRHLQFLGTPESGRRTALLAAVLGLAAIHTPREVDFYVFDFGYELKRLEDLPHNLVYYTSNEGDSRKFLLEQLIGEMDHRRELFANVPRGVTIENLHDYREYCRKSGTGGNEDLLPAAQVMVIDNYSLWRRSPEYHDDEVVSWFRNLVQEGARYGIHVILSANRHLDLDSGRLWENFESVLLQMDPDDLYVAGQNRKMYALWKDRPGRGFTVGVNPYNLIETQCIAPVSGEPRIQYEGLERVIGQIKQKYAPVQE